MSTEYYKARTTAKVAPRQNMKEPKGRNMQSFESFIASLYHFMWTPSTLQSMMLSQWRI